MYIKCRQFYGKHFRFSFTMIRIKIKHYSIFCKTVFYPKMATQFVKNGHRQKCNMSKKKKKKAIFLDLENFEIKTCLKY